MPLVYVTLAEGTTSQDQRAQIGDGIYRALIDKKVDIVAGNSTDGLIDALHLVGLSDDRHYFPPYEAVAVMRDEMLKAHPEVKSALDVLASKISDEDMRRMNYAVDRQHRDPGEVVHEFLEGRQLLQRN